MKKLRIVFLATATAVAAFALGAAAPARASVGVTLAPAIAGFPYKGCLTSSPLPGTSYRAQDGNNLNSYQQQAGPPNITMGFQADSFWCLVGETLGFSQYNFDVVAWSWGTDGDGVGNGTPLETYNVTMFTYLPKFIMEGPGTGMAGEPFSTKLQIYTDPHSDLGWTPSVTAGTFPPGLSISGNGNVTGTPTQPGTYNFTTSYTTDAIPWQNSNRPSRSWTLTFAQPITVTLETASLPNTEAYQPYSQTLSVGGNGTAPFTWTLATGTLPPGLTLTPSGTLAGVPTEAGDYTFAIKVADTAGRSSSKEFKVTVTWPELEFSPLTMKVGQQGKLYYQRLIADNGRGPYTYTLALGSKLPRGLGLTKKGVITGVPKVFGTFRFTVNVVDANGAPGAKTYSLKLKKKALVKKKKVVKRR